ncbi:MAG: hypothetical protein IIB10_13050 [Chloroflexi bacterium]|nr:hypothetical protein [Chloroflexota bacterium]
MGLKPAELVTATEVIEGLCEHLLIQDVPEDASYTGFLSIDEPFGLDYKGFHEFYRRLLSFVLSLDDIGALWSQDAIEGKIHTLLIDLAKRRYEGEEAPDFASIAHDWLADIGVEFEEFGCYVPVVGLSIDTTLEIGTVMFHPLDSLRSEFEGQLISPYREHLHPLRDCIASSVIRAEKLRAIELLQIEVNWALNVLRLMGSLVWHNQPQGSIYVGGQEPKGSSYAVALGTQDSVSKGVDTGRVIPPFRIDDEFLQVAKVYGLDHIRDIASSDSQTELERAFLLSIQWYGEGIRETLPLYEFVKFYVAIEIASKKKSESSTKKHLPRRLSVLIYPWSKEKQRNLEDGIGDLIDERNAVFHGGSPEKQSEDYLAWFSRVVAMQTLHHLRMAIEQEGLDTKEALDSWVQQQYATYLQ